jgi:hypothetical protein
MRRYAEGLPFMYEAPAEIKAAQSDQLRERGDRYRLGKVPFMYEVTLRSCQGARPPGMALRAFGRALQHQFMRQNDAKTSEMRAALLGSVLDHSLEL